MQQKNTKALVMIVNAGYADDVIDLAREAGAKGATIINARGVGVQREVFMGITVDSEKEIVLCLVDAATADKVMAVVHEKAGPQKPAHTVCLTMPVDKMIGISTCDDPRS